MEKGESGWQGGEKTSAEAGPHGASKRRVAITRAARDAARAERMEWEACCGPRWGMNTMGLHRLHELHAQAELLLKLELGAEDSQKENNKQNSRRVQIKKCLDIGYTTRTHDR